MCCLFKPANTLMSILIRAEVGRSLPGGLLSVTRNLILFDILASSSEGAFHSKTCQIGRESEEMEAQTPVNQPPPNRNGPHPNQKRNARRKKPQHSADIVFTKGTSIHTMPSLSKQLKAVTDCIIGLQYVWEYRSPSKSVPPHYQCKLCVVSRLQNDMLAHVKGWKHSYRYLKKVHPEKVIHEEKDAIKDPAIRKAIKEVAAEVEKTEGRGQLKVILKEPCEVPAFKGLRSAAPKFMPPPPPLPPPPPPSGMGLNGPPFGPRFSNPRFPGEFPPQGGPLSDYPGGEFDEPGFGGYSTRQDFLDSGMDQRPFPDGMGHRPAGNSFGQGAGRDGYGRSGLLKDNPGRMYPEDYRGGQMGSSSMDKSLDRPGLMGAAPESNSLPNTLLTYLDTFRIENESDAQLVLKVTQKLTDVLMEYRLRSVSTGSSLNSLSMSSTGFSSTPSRLPSSSERYSLSLSGSSSYSDSTPRYYK